MHSTDILKIVTLNITNPHYSDGYLSLSNFVPYCTYYQYTLVSFCTNIWPWFKVLTTFGFMPPMYTTDSNYFPSQLLYYKTNESN